ncbi:MAG: Chlorogenate esterase [Sphingomonas bacterium]|nr:Chlorogenate esterase [Sphingomonas bacterium]
MAAGFTAYLARAVILLLGLCAIAAPASAAAGDCAGLKRIAIPHVEILIAAEVSGTYQEDMAVGRAGRRFDGLPAFCRVRGISRPVAGSEIGFEVWLPVKGWSGRLHMIGNGGYVSNISTKQMIARLEDGDVAVGTDTGHSGTDLEFGWKHPERIKDFGYRAVHESVIAAKALTHAYYGRPPRFSYFSGCSTGGYQGLSEAQRYPDDFNGIIAGAPGNNRTNLTMAFLWNYLANHRPGDDTHPILSTSDLLLLNRAVIAQCDTLDGVKDGVVSDPRVCRFRVASLACKPGNAPGTCLSAEQIAAAEKIYAGPTDKRTGKQIYPGYPFGTEGVTSGPGDKHPGWSGYWSETENTQESSRADFFRYWVFDDPKWNWWSFDWGRDVDTVVARQGPVFNAVDTNLSPFAKRGGKLMMFMGWQDPVGTPYEAINYYNAVEARTPGNSKAARQAQTQAFLRLFMVPGMDHCAGGPGATNMSTATRDSTPPVKDADHDMTRALEAWVEQDRAPQSLIGTHYAADAAEDGKGPRPIAFQRPICVFPKKPVYKSGPTEAASSFVCA